MTDNDLKQGSLHGAVKRYKCMGDGTYAEVVAAEIDAVVHVEVDSLDLASIEIKGPSGNIAEVDAGGRLLLSSGAASEAGQTAQQAALEDIVANTAGRASAAKQDIQSTKLDAIAASVAALTKPADVQQVSGTVAVSNLPATQPISGSVAVSNLPATQPVSGSVSVSNFPGSQAVTGPLTDAQLRATALPLPTGAAIESGNLASIKAKTDNLDAALSTRALESGGNLAGVKTNTDKLDVALSTVATAARQDAQTADLDAIKAAAQAGATAAKQDTGNASLASLDSKLPTLGQMLAKYAVPVVLASDNDTIAARIERRIAEQQLLADVDAAMAAHTRRAFERGSRVDARGRFERGTRC